MLTLAPSLHLYRVTVFVFAAIPTGFSVVYAHTFADHVSVQWCKLARHVFARVDSVDRNEFSNGHVWNMVAFTEYDLHRFGFELWSWRAFNSCLKSRSQLTMFDNRVSRLQGWAIDIALNVVVIETAFVLVSFYAAWIYVKLRRSVLYGGQGQVIWWTNRGDTVIVWESRVWV